MKITTIIIICLLTALGIVIAQLIVRTKAQQNQRAGVDSAIASIDSFLSGKTEERIECNREGELDRLFHAINNLAAVLNANAEKEQESRVFLKNTISDISHQLKTPLAALNIYNGLLQDTSEPDDVHEYVRLSEQELDRIETLVQNMLKITRFDAGSIELVRTSEDLAEIMTDIERHFAVRAEQEQKRLCFEGQSVMVLCDKTWFSEAIMNMVKNALDHTEAGDTVEVKWCGLPNITRITVEDTGSGIHPEDIHYIFKRFYRSRFSKDTFGTGLGLSLAKSIIDLHKGIVTVDSSLGEGSTFVINILNNGE